MNIEFQTIGKLLCGPVGGGLGASMTKLVFPLRSFMRLKYYI